jgi:exoribonuclease R
LYPIENWVPWNYGTTRLFADDEEPESPASEQDAARVEIVAPSRRGVPLVPTGKVVGILQASSREADIVAVFPSTNSTKNAKSEVDEAVSAVMGKEEFVLVYPLDRALPKMRIRTRQRNWLEGKKIVIRIDSWNRNSQYPDAHFVHCLGDNFDFNTEITALLTKYGVSNRPFSMEAMSCLPDVFDPKGTLESYDCGWKVDDREVRQRRDYRKKRNIFRYASMHELTV